MKLASIFLSICLSISAAYSECTHEYSAYGQQLLQNKNLSSLYIMDHSGKFQRMPAHKINPIQKYIVQKSSAQTVKDFSRYNKKYIEYYRYHHVQDYLAQQKSRIEKINYETIIVGKSLEGRDLYSVRPKFLDPNKKTIVMFGRHHGDEGTANWIIEGFVNRLLIADKNFFDQYQLILYPMVNPDGAEAQSRYNKNKRDLNRSWSMNLSKNHDEAKTIHTDLKKLLSKLSKVSIVLDMHGSFYEDFIYRVDEDFLGRDFYNHQQEFIDQLARYDRWQAGNFNISNGHPKMARIVMNKDYGIHALTHETPRDIKLKNSKARSKASLLKQGEDVFQTINELY